ncbi:hypothetical protein Cabys_1404 [Caldithrix abyssi DSM 13497]|uniref:Uncharacterized protein n=1 Tax=Caldithrix abyssi DSM 13497 TaxID=880073 RepID=A0A1J1C782_CALAY|nr:hypothetical protein Cabys_1404 [Caldithrix abyssi DSM 13497]
MEWFDLKIPKGCHDYSETVSTVYANEQRNTIFHKQALPFQPERLHPGHC